MEWKPSSGQLWAIFEEDLGCIKCACIDVLSARYEGIFLQYPATSRLGRPKVARAGGETPGMLCITVCQGLRRLLMHE